MATNQPNPAKQASDEANVRVARWMASRAMSQRNHFERMADSLMHAYNERDAGLRKAYDEAARSFGELAYQVADQFHIPGSEIDAARELTATQVECAHCGKDTVVTACASCGEPASQPTGPQGAVVEAWLVERLDGHSEPYQPRRSVVDSAKYDASSDAFWASKEVKAAHRITPLVAALPVAVGAGEDKPVDDAMVIEWMERHDLSGALSLTDARAAIEDAQSIESAPTPATPAGKGG